MNSNNKTLALIIGIIVVFIVGILVLSFFNLFPAGVKKGTVTIASHKFTVEEAQKESDQRKGLSNRNSLDDDTGMLFLFPREDMYAFWMKDMKFPIDILFINDEKIVTIYENVPYPQSTEENLNPPTYLPSEPVNRVLELKAGTVSKYSIKTGDTVTIDL